MVSFVPTFEPTEPNCVGAFVGEVPELINRINGEDFFYIFIVDRSGSMDGRRLEVTKNEMKLFMQSLPPKCKFQIISFGGSYSKIGYS